MQRTKCRLMVYFGNAMHAFTNPAAGNDNSKGLACPSRLIAHGNTWAVFFKKFCSRARIVEGLPADRLLRSCRHAAGARNPKPSQMAPWGASPRASSKTFANVRSVKQQLDRFLAATGQAPLKDYITFGPHAGKNLEAEDQDLIKRQAWYDGITDHMPIDDDTNYTVTGLLVMEKNGRDFTPADMAVFWMSNLPLLSTCTAERVAYRNFSRLIQPPESALSAIPFASGSVRRSEQTLSVTCAQGIPRGRRSLPGETRASRMSRTGFTARCSWPP